MKLDLESLNMLHGADYNPEQWLDRPDVLAEDIRMMKKAGVNCVSMGMFSWVALEPEEGVYTLDWLCDIVEALYQNDIYTILATPSGARPAWMARKYPEVLRVSSDLTRNLMGERHNHCYTSPVYREKVKQINIKLSETLGKHPGVILWHLSNEYGGECFCPLCQAEFRNWLKAKYKTLDNLNKSWWTAFWSHTYTDWEQVEAPVPKGERNAHGLVLDWRRFVTDRTVDFCTWEKDSVREGGSELPVTTNLMIWFYGLNYFKFRDVIDVVSWDSYPEWHGPKADMDVAAYTACFHDIMRCIKQKPFLLMESTPSCVNWRSPSKLKRPGMHMLSSMQAIAHGSDSVQYFQWRKSRGSSEKFHGAVVSHDGRDDTRVFKDVAEVGARLKGLERICGAMPEAKVALIYDWENEWVLNEIHGPRRANMGYKDTVVAHYKALWQLGIPVDVLDMECDFEAYDLVVAPMLYMRRADIDAKLSRFVEAGGVLVGGCFDGVADSTDICYLGDVPAGMTDVYGIRSEEIDGLYDDDYNSLEWDGCTYRLRQLCERVHVTTAKVLASYGQDFYRGEPVVTVNSYGKGTAYYLAANAEDSFYAAFYRKLCNERGIASALSADLPLGVTVTRRKGTESVIILQNFNNRTELVRLHAPVRNIETGEEFRLEMNVAPYEVCFLESIDEKH